MKPEKTIIETIEEVRLLLLEGKTITKAQRDAIIARVYSLKNAESRKTRDRIKRRIDNIIDETFFDLEISKDEDILEEIISYCAMQGNFTKEECIKRIKEYDFEIMPDDKSKFLQKLREETANGYLCFHVPGAWKQQGEGSWVSFELPDLPDRKRNQGEG